MAASKPTTRELDKADKRARLWAAKYAAADTPAKLAAFEFDRIRSRIAELPTNRQAAAFKKLARLLSDHHANLGEVTPGDVHA